MFLSCLTIIRRSLVITYHRISVYIVRHSWKKLIDLKQEDHRSATRLRAISPFTPASDERENQEDRSRDHDSQGSHVGKGRRRERNKEEEETPELEKARERQ